MEKKVTSIRVGYTIHKAAKFVALARGITMRELTERGLQLQIDEYMSGEHVEAPIARQVERWQAERVEQDDE